ncbi:hypothetical protein [Salinactinospora qingdaonensis]|uniref:hypothetical protein n=1 Tax=Salinactinospora qingdaonensis TaxID=702744 RepID=UPI0031E7A04B
MSVVDATFAARHASGLAGVVGQSAGVGIAPIDHLSRLSVGASTAATAVARSAYGRPLAR